MKTETTTIIKYQIGDTKVDFLTRFHKGSPKTFSEIFKGETYPAIKIFSPETIFDIGANIVATSIFFSIKKYLKDVNLLYIECHSSSDREEIKKLLCDTHIVLREKLVGANQKKVDKS